ncbi:CRISPR-associated protein, NE0113 family, partial [Nitrosomonas sp. Nm132]
MVEMKSANYSRRVLLLVTGLTPQVVTETLYALAVQSQEKFIPTEIHVISTGEGAERARLSLLDPSIGQFYALCKDYGLHDIAFPLENIHVIEDTFGNPLSDIRTPEDNLRAADYIVDFVRNFCSDTSLMLHVSIAGGRKSMGFFAGYALSEAVWQNIRRILQVLFSSWRFESYFRQCLAGFRSPLINGESYPARRTCVRLPTASVKQPIYLR